VFSPQQCVFVHAFIGKGVEVLMTHGPHGLQTMLMCGQSAKGKGDDHVWQLGAALGETNAAAAIDAPPPSPGENCVQSEGKT